MVSVPLSTIKPEGGSKCSYADILNTNIRSLLGSNPHPLSARYNNQKELSCNLLQLTPWGDHHFMI